ncbi:MAG: hypothetical protein G01um1014106_203 [Parcubacteria group bacterium Gr01-1014_106]|nr:MAG: hypothetical protein G01um1014106_203 [Parcubacteria group bacterium Gr01-1014_106]
MTPSKEVLSQKESNMIEELRRIFDYVKVDYRTHEPILTLIETQDYLKTLAQFLTVEGLNFDGEWETAVATHRMVVAWQPENAHTWLEAVVDHPGMLRAPQGPYYGTFLGLLEAGVALDTEWCQTPFQAKLLPKLTELLCRGTPTLPHHRSGNANHAEFQKRLVHALKTFLFPVKSTHRLCPPHADLPEISEPEMQQSRAAQTTLAVDYLFTNIGTGSQNELLPVFVERLTHALLARMTPAQKVAAIHHVL